MRMAILFGSHAVGRPAPGRESDLDIAVRDTRPAGTKRFYALYKALSSVFPGYNLDLAFLGDADPLFRYEVTSRGRLLYGDSLEFLEYKAYAYRDYVDSQDLFRLEEKLLRRRLCTSRTSKRRRFGTYQTHAFPMFGTSKRRLHAAA
ncbi:MAG: nucleotidyltransferase domain-containing protein [Elusimicrobia bacterium]|nr:nucleotidyltransferase domain-containing protein [Elusimicrobiota bacterium]